MRSNLCTIVVAFSLPAAQASSRFPNHLSSSMLSLFQGLQKGREVVLWLVVLLVFQFVVFVYFVLVSGHASSAPERRAA